MYYENLIALTTAQHMQEAHPGGNTRQIDTKFQYTCLIAKTDSIRKNLLRLTTLLRYIVLTILCMYLTPACKLTIFQEYQRVTLMLLCKASQ